MDNDQLLAVATWVLGAATVCLALAGTVPHLLAALGLGFFRTGIEGGPSDLDPDGKGETYGELYRQLIDLGFEPLGKSWEKAEMRKIDSFIFLHRQEGFRASIWPLLGGDYRMYFLTMFTDGAAVLTANYPRPTQDAADYFAQGVPTVILANALAEHRKSTARFVERGHKVWAPHTLEDIPEQKRRYHYHPAIRRNYLKNKWSIFRNKAIVLLLFPAAAAGLAHWAGYPAFLASLVAFLTCVFFTAKLKELLHKTLKEIGAEQREADRERRQGGR